MSWRDRLGQRGWLLLAGAVLVVLLGSTRLATFYTEVLWFRSLGFDEVFWSVLLTRFGLGIVAGVVLAAAVFVNLMIARRLAPEYRLPTSQEEVIERYRQVLAPFARLAMIAVALVAGLFSGLSVVGQWRTYLLWANGGSFGIDDPHFGIDLGFFVFELPFLSLVNRWLFSALATTVVLSLIAHYIFGGLRPQSPSQRITPAASVHLSVLLALVVGVRAWGFWLDRYLLSYSDRGVVTGLSYTDVNASLRAYELLTVIALVCVVLFLLNMRYRGWVLPSAGVAILLVANILLAGLYPVAIQQLQVAPQELEREREFIARNLEFTRYAYQLDPEHVSYENFPAAAELTAAEVDANAGTLNSIRLWDPATLANTYAQLQELRPYYDFRDVDVDRYPVEEGRSQVMLAVREISETELPVVTWQNQRIVFTHGYGVVASRVSTAGADGQPEFLSSNLPAEAVPALELDEPRMYFGENPPTYSIVGASSDEFDFETAEGQEFTRYDGADGVPISSPLRRLAFALRYAEPNILLSGLITDESRIMFNRDVVERVEAIAPFLQLDHDPYPAVVDGRVQWILDAYTITDMVPYSQRVELEGLTLAEELVLVERIGQDGQVVVREELRPVAGLEGQANYLRNSVKAVVDAYDGTVTLYVTEPDDPLIEAWDRTFPDLLTPLSEASESLREHFRYPEDLFRVQAEMLSRYHIQNPDAFYTQSDAWEIPDDSAFSNNDDSNPPRTRQLPPTYQLLRLPGEEDEEFALVQPLTPRNREVLSAYLAARGDPDGYGELRVLAMPPSQTVFGPEQVQARINQDDAVSQQITLWNESGSRVIYGNLIVVPVEDSLLYVQPLFLRDATSSEIPELRRVVLVFGDQVVLETSLATGLEAIFGDLTDIVEGGVEEEVPTGEEPPAPPPGAEVVAPEVADLLTQALEAFAEAEAALAEGDLGAYQELVEEAEGLLEDAEAALSPPR